jgi:alkylated DNA repair dioxygenase AlkB
MSTSVAEDDATGAHLGIPGLIYVPDLLTAEEQRHVLARIDQASWLTELRRRVQHYGYRYDYKARRIDHSMRLGPLPAFALEVAERLMARALTPELPDQAIVNEYQPGQGISSHVDCESCFKSTIVTVSLGSCCEMDFISLDRGRARATLLEPGSALVLKDIARYRWQHRIRARLSDHGVARGRRVSLTFRNVILT